MGFFGVLGEIAKNNKNYNQWEIEQRNKQAQREALYRQKQHTEEELKEAEEQGKKIIEIIDVMDNHSESVSENVETAVQPILGVAPLLGSVGAALLSGKFIIDPANKNIEKIKDELVKKDSTRKLYARIYKYNQNNKYFYTSDLYDNTLGLGDITRKGIKDPELRLEVQKFYKDFAEQAKKYRNKKAWGIAAIPLTFLASFIGGTIFATKVQVDSSKIARYQARKALEDPKAFVKYTPEQIEQAKAEIEANPDLKKKKKKKEKLNQGFFKSIFGILRDRKAYKKAAFNDSDDSKIVTRNLTPEELTQAKKDQEVIQRTIRLINNEAEKYSENMEVAAGVLIGGTPLLGALVGGLTSWLLNKTGALDKVLDNAFLDNGSEKQKELYAELKKLNKEFADPNIKHNAKQKFLYNSKFAEFFNEVNKSLEIENNGKKVKFTKKLNSLFKTGMFHKNGRNWILAGIGAMTTGLAGLVIGLKLQKSAARAGRYTAKRELEKDPRNFIGYTEEDFETVKDVKETQKPKSKVKEVIFFIPTVIKQYNAYNKYKKTEFKTNKLLQEQLLKQDVSEEQLTDARNLQRKLFNTFEKVDDKSQLYSESMEAATEIAQPFIMYGAYGAILAPFIFGAIKLLKLKENPGQLLNKLTGWISNSSWVMNSKVSKKYLNGVAENLPVATMKTHVEHKPLAAMLEGVNLAEDSIFSIVSKSWQNLRKSPEKLRTLEDWQVDQILYQIEKQLTKLKPENKEISSLFSTLRLSDHKAKIDILDIILNPQNIKNMPKEDYNRAIALIERYVPFEKMGTYIDRARVAQLKLFGSKIQEIFSLNEQETKALMSFVNEIEQRPDRVLQSLFNKTLKQENVIGTVEVLEKIANKIKQLPKEIKNNPEVQRLLELEINLNSYQTKAFEALKEINNDPAKAREIIQNLRADRSRHPVQAQESISISDLLDVFKNSAGKLKNSTLKDSLTLIPESIKNPQKMIETLKKEIEKMSPEEYKIWAERFGSLIEKNTILEIIPKIEKIINNVPKEELKNILEVAVKTFNENPDEFVKLITSDSGLSKIFMTPDVKKAMTALGIAYPTFILILTYAFQSWLAEMQLKAGRLGVMKSLEELEDPRYYANVIKDTNI